jgi:hypothetical protein
MRITVIRVNRCEGFGCDDWMAGPDTKEDIKTVLEPGGFGDPRVRQTYQTDAIAT